MCHVDTLHILLYLQLLKRMNTEQDLMTDTDLLNRKKGMIL